jgi:hypothetical protein
MLHPPDKLLGNIRRVNKELKYLLCRTGPLNELPIKEYHVTTLGGQKI